MATSKSNSLWGCWRKPFKQTIQIIYHGSKFCILSFAIIVPPHIVQQKKSPGEILFGRPLCTKLPELNPKQPSCDDTLRHTDAAAKTKMKWYADMKYRTKSSNLKVDDIVLCRQHKSGKLCSAFEPQPYKVISVKGPMIPASSGTRKVTRNSSHFKVLCSSKSHTGKKKALEIQWMMVGNLTSQVKP